MDEQTNVLDKKLPKWIIPIFLIFLIGCVVFSVQMVLTAVFKSGDDSEKVTVVSEDVKTEQTAIEPMVQIATLFNVPMSKLSEQFATSLNSVGNLVVDTDEYKLFIETKDGVTSNYVEVQLKNLGSCTKSGAVKNSDGALELVGLKSQLKGNPTNPPAGIANGAIEYCEYPSNMFAPGVSCSYDGGYYDVSLTPRTYCEN